MKILFLLRRHSAFPFLLPPFHIFPYFTVSLDCYLCFKKWYLHLKRSSLILALALWLSSFLYSRSWKVPAGSLLYPPSIFILLQGWTIFLCRLSSKWKFQPSSMTSAHFTSLLPWPPSLGQGWSEAHQEELPHRQLRLLGIEAGIEPHRSCL